MRIREKVKATQRLTAMHTKSLYFANTLEYCDYGQSQKNCFATGHHFDLNLTKSMKKSTDQNLVERQRFYMCLNWMMRQKYCRDTFLAMFTLIKHSFLGLLRFISDYLFLCWFNFIKQIQMPRLHDKLDKLVRIWWKTTVLTVFVVAFSLFRRSECFLIAAHVGTFRNCNDLCLH